MSPVLYATLAVGQALCSLFLFGLIFFMRRRAFLQGWYCRSAELWEGAAHAIRHDWTPIDWLKFEGLREPTVPPLLPPRRAPRVSR